MNRRGIAKCLYCRKPFSWKRRGDHYAAINPDGSPHNCPERARIEKSRERRDDLEAENAATAIMAESRD